MVVISEKLENFVDNFIYEDRFLDEDMMIQAIKQEYDKEIQKIKQSEDDYHKANNAIKNDETLWEYKLIRPFTYNHLSDLMKSDLIHYEIDSWDKFNDYYMNGMDIDLMIKADLIKIDRKVEDESSFTLIVEFLENKWKR
ncbi:hypothetical protein AALK46_12925 [Staphylococcus nepalensis]|uniref:hypothetical protein n=1 Tax=Staphylococcus TaxID=1279 RepID=UPI002DBA3A14|nr:hypothetical protein [Staphylococcus pseudoxylosus]MEB6038022.1 hypothetical protein [Staphylococcus pseudoxylosus]